MIKPISSDSSHNIQHNAVDKVKVATGDRDLSVLQYIQAAIDTIAPINISRLQPDTDTILGKVFDLLEAAGADWKRGVAVGVEPKLMKAIAELKKIIDPDKANLRELLITTILYIEHAIIRMVVHQSAPPKADSTPPKARSVRSRLRHMIRALKNGEIDLL